MLFIDERVHHRGDYVTGSRDRGFGFELELELAAAHLEAKLEHSWRVGFAGLKNKNSELGFLPFSFLPSPYLFSVGTSQTACRERLCCAVRLLLHVRGGGIEKD